jgi:hypothetical protein
VRCRGALDDLFDADVTVTTSFLIGPTVRPAARERYAADIARAAAGLTRLENAATTSGNPRLVRSLAAVAAGLPETALVIGPAAGGSTAGFARVETDLSRAINADHAVFHASAIAGRDAYAGLDVVIIAAAVLMAAGCAWGLSRRLAEYR